MLSKMTTNATLVCVMFLLNRNNVFTRFSFNGVKSNKFFQATVAIEQLEKQMRINVCVYYIHQDESLIL